LVVGVVDAEADEVREDRVGLRRSRCWSSVSFATPEPWTSSRTWRARRCWARRFEGSAWWRAIVWAIWGSGMRVKRLR